jgi:ribonuclease I
MTVSADQTGPAMKVTGICGQWNEHGYCEYTQQADYSFHEHTSD